MFSLLTRALLISFPCVLVSHFLHYFFFISFHHQCFFPPLLLLHFHCLIFACIAFSLFCELCLCISLAPSLPHLILSNDGKAHTALAYVRVHSSISMNFLKIIMYNLCIQTDWSELKQDIQWKTVVERVKNIFSGIAQCCCCCVRYRLWSKVLVFFLVLL